MRKYAVSMEIEVTVLIDDEVINVVDDEWRKDLYDLKTDEEIIEHIAYNLLRGWHLSNLDGWANLTDDKARLVGDELFDSTVTRLE